MASVGNYGGVVGFGTDVAWQAYALTQTQAIVQYLRLSVWPYPLVFDYGTGLANSVGEVVPCALLVAAVLVGTLIALWRWPAVGFLGAFAEPGRHVPRDDRGDRVAGHVGDEQFDGIGADINDGAAHRPGDTTPPPQEQVRQ